MIWQAARARRLRRTWSRRIGIAAADPVVARIVEEAALLVAESESFRARVQAGHTTIAPALRERCVRVADRCERVARELVAVVGGPEP
jgi:hypothetical protein